MRTAETVMTLDHSIPRDVPVLIIDDDETVAGSLRHSLSQIGCAADVVYDFCDAARMMSTHRYAVVVVDPYLTGAIAESAIAILESIALMQPHSCVIVLTAYATSAVQRAAQASARSLVLNKPQPITRLCRIVVEQSIQFPVIPAPGEPLAEL